ncbi:MAG: GNAT family N-acetyltransferase [Alphaproteobacteria bacterium]|nr:GNAT family N-acetyltransferase [Alphaproteobacteria bacterium]
MSTISSTSSAGIAVRPARADDAPAIQAIYAPIVETTFISFEETAPDVAETERRIAAIQQRHLYLVAERDNAVVGFAYGGPHRERAAYRYSVDVTVYVAETARRQGIGRLLYGELLPGLAALGYHSAFAGIALPNAGSVGLHEAMGFTPVGIYREVGWKFGAWRDVGWWQRLL